MNQHEHEGMFGGRHSVCVHITITAVQMNEQQIKNNIKHKNARFRWSLCTCGVRLTVVLTTVLHLDGRQAERFDHLVRSLTPVGGAEGQDGQGQSQGG